MLVRKMKTLILLTVLGTILLSNVSGQNFAFPWLNAGQNSSYYSFYEYANKSISDYGFQTVNPVFVSFRLWTRNLTMMYYPLTLGQLANNTFFQQNATVKIIVHGYLSCADHNWVTKMKNAYLGRYDTNVILVNWGMAAMQQYPTSAGYTKDIGRYVGKLMVELNQVLNVPYNTIHCIGHSLGAHICGFAGDYVKSLKCTIFRISALDPSGPLFAKATPDLRLNKTDASYVDVYHTDNTYYGFALPIGTFDVYYNGGDTPQPGCDSSDRSKDIFFGCSHRRAYKYFSESINKNTSSFLATSCSSAVVYYLKACIPKASPMRVGEDSFLATIGSFYLTTNAYPPYGRYGLI